MTAATARISIMPDFTAGIASYMDAETRRIAVRELHKAIRALAFRVHIFESFDVPPYYDPHDQISRSGWIGLKWTVVL